MKYCSDLDLDKLEYTTIRTNKKIEYINIECGFDIETTSTLVNGEKVAFMYEWTFGIKNSDFVYYGRTWEEFISLCEQIQDHFKLSEDRILICYVHNLSYEFQFMRKYFEWLNVFSVSDRKPIKTLCNYGIEFRDSYILSGYNLEMLAKNLQFHKIEKLVGSLDYDKIRHYKTPLTHDELEYCKHDVIIILAYINEQIKLYGDITKIPLTNTGRVRKYVKDRCYHTNTNHRKDSRAKFFKYRKLMEELTITKDEYYLSKRAFMGGFTHANANYSGKIMENVSSIDFTSSYPAVMLMEKFPMGRGIPVKFKNKNDFISCLQRYCVVFDISFTNIRAKFYNENYLSESKCRNLKNQIINNGRVFSSDVLETTITNVDFEIIKQCYEWDSFTVANGIKYCKGYLPKDIINSIIKLYEDKTVLKGIEGKEVEYLLSKGMLNSVYGMCVTDIVRNEISYIDEWEVNSPNVDEQIEKYNTTYSRFLFYVWGIFVTAYARRNLWIGIINIDDDYIYSDTDSIKFLNLEKHTNFITEYNKLVEYKLKAMCKFHKIPFEKLKPKNQKGNEKLIGIWDYEGTYSRFKTLGAKRYLVEEQGELTITVAGLPKKAGVEYLKETYKTNDNIFKHFNDELYIPADKTGKLTHTYVDVDYNFLCTDYTGITTEIYTMSGVHLSKCDFTLSIAKQYGEFINNLLNGYIYRGVSAK